MVNDVIHTPVLAGSRLMLHDINFAACYADLNNFKPFNDHYGYWRGDEMIRLVAKVMVAHCDAQRDFGYSPRGFRPTAAMFPPSDV